MGLTSQKKKKRTNCPLVIDNTYYTCHNAYEIDRGD